MAEPALPPAPAPHNYSDFAGRRIQVSREKRPLNFFVTLAKKFLATDDVVELSGLGLAVTTVVTIAEILRKDRLVSVEHIETSLVEPHPDGHTTAPKAKIQIWIRRSPHFDNLITNHHNSRSNHSATPASAAAPPANSPDTTAPAAQLEAGDTNPTAPSKSDDAPADQLPVPTEEPVAAAVTATAPATTASGAQTTVQSKS